jgi:hypothetical protein
VPSSLTTSYELIEIKEGSSPLTVDSPECWTKTLFHLLMYTLGSKQMICLVLPKVSLDRDRVLAKIRMVLRILPN